MRTPRRNFIKQSALGMSALGMASAGMAQPAPASSVLEGRLPREVWIATLTQEGIYGKDCPEMLERTIAKMEGVLPQQPDIICLPETFHYAGIQSPKPTIPEVARDWETPITEAMSAFARKHQCYVIAPIHTLAEGKVYIAAVLFDRAGERMGGYRKIRVTEDEMDAGVTPGTPDPPVFQTDFGVIGIQICFDVEWMDGWQQLQRKGAEIVFWPSAFAGGKMINTMAWRHQYYVVSSTLKGTTKICDISGDEIASSGAYNRWGVCAPVNLEKVFLHSWPYSQQFAAIEEKYGRKVRISTQHEEEFSIIESCSPDVKVADILQEFNLKTMQDHLLSAQRRQEEHWNT
ncbi:MAG: carbon-nitrogen hydrolase family protein [Cyclobacteriaceae bacterium]